MERSPLRVLIIGEDSGHLERIKDIFSPTDLHLQLVEVGSYGRSFLRDTQRTPPSAILMHIPTGTMKSLSALASMRMLHPEVPIIVLGSDPSVLNVAVSQDLSRPRLVPGDVDPAELRAVVRSAIEERAEGSDQPAERTTLPASATKDEEARIPLPDQLQLEALFPGYRVFIGSDGP